MSGRLPAFPLCTLARIAADAAVSATPCRIWKILLVAGTDVAQAEFTNDADGSGTNVIQVKASANSQAEIDFTAVGGVNFDSKCFADISGTSPILHVWYTNG